MSGTRCGAFLLSRLIVAEQEIISAANVDVCPAAAAALEVHRDHLDE